jgi:hypothetical protein
MAEITEVAAVPGPVPVTVTGILTLQPGETNQSIVATGTPVGGGTAVTVGTLTDVPAGPFTVNGSVPSGDYVFSAQAVDIAVANTGTVTV